MSIEDELVSHIAILVMTTHDLVIIDNVTKCGMNEQCYAGEINEVC